MATPINMAEPVRRAEIVPANLRGLRDKLRAAWNTTSIWDVGDQWHDYGFHRSRAWVLGSGFSRFGSGDYSVQGSANQGGDANWVAALDFALSDPQLAQVYARLDPALKAGKLPQVRELLKEPGHGHLSFYRSRANDDHTLLYQIMTGQVPVHLEEDDVFTLTGTDPGSPTKGTYLITGLDLATGRPWAIPISSSALADYKAAGIAHRSVPNVNAAYYSIKAPPLTATVAVELTDEQLAEIEAAAAAGAAAGAASPEEIADAVVDEQAERLKD